MSLPVDTSGHIPWYRRVGFRVGILVALIVLLVDLGSWGLADRLMTDEISQAELARVVEQYEKTGEVQWFSDAQRRQMMRDSVIFAVLLALFAAWLVSRLATRRLAHLAREAAGPVTAEQLPGPFDVAGADEISSLARSLNAMRTRIDELIGELDRRDEERRDWIAQVSHDLRTPMTAMAVGLERAQRLLGQGGEVACAEARDMIASVVLDVRRVQTLAEDLLEIARLDSSAALRLEPVPVGELVRETVASLHPVAMEHGIQLVADVPAGLPTLEADGGRLQRALENLIANAIRHAHASVCVSASTSGRRLSFCVEDDGAGFEDAPGVLSLESLGTLPLRRGAAGLGLQVALRIALAHSGELSATDRESGGATLRMQIPILDRATSSARFQSRSRDHSSWHHVLPRTPDT